MADQEVQKTAPEVAQQEFVVVTDVPRTEKTMEKEAVPVPEKETAEAVAAEKPPAAEAADRGGDDVSDKVDPDSCTFKEESTKLSDLPENEKKALLDFRQLVQELLNKREFSAQPPESEAESKEKKTKEKEEEPAQPQVVPEESKAQKLEAEAEPAKPEAVPDESNAENVEPEAVDETTKSNEKETKEEEVAVDKTENTVAVPCRAPVDDDGAKTVEAIEETIVAVSSASASASDSAVQKEQQETLKTEEGKKTETHLQPEEVSMWGIPLLADERSDVILLKFLRARDFKVKEAFAMLKNTIRWRREFGIDELVEQDLGFDDLEKVVFMHGFDREGHPVCYNVYGEFQNKELYQKTFSDEEKREKFLKWRIQFLEKSIRKLDFAPGGISTIVQINDLKNSPGPGKWELRQATKQALHLLQDNYPEFVARQVFINVPWWYLAVNKMISPFLTQRTRSKFVFAGPSKSAETLFRYIAAEQVPVKYGGLSKDGEFDTTDAVTEITVRPSAKHTVEFPVTENCSLAWEVRVVGWEVNYSVEFIPSAEESYTVIIQKSRKVGSNEEPVICNSFKTDEAGKVVITIDNLTSKKKKKLLYRLKTIPSLD